MKYHKSRIHPIIRVTYKTFFGNLITRDICKSQNVEDYWEFMDNGELTHNFGPINIFYESNLDIYWVNSTFVDKE